MSMSDSFYVATTEDEKPKVLSRYHRTEMTGSVLSRMTSGAPSRYSGSTDNGEVDQADKIFQVNNTSIEEEEITINLESNVENGVASDSQIPLDYGLTSAKDGKKSSETHSDSNDSSLQQKSNRANTNRRSRGSMILHNNAGTSIFTNIHAKAQMKEIKDHPVKNIIFPYSNFYRIWWVFTVVATALTFFFETYQIAFSPGGLNPFSSPDSILNVTLIAIFAIDISVNFNLAFYNEDHEIIFSRKEISKNYLRFYFWIDLIGVMPFYPIALWWGGLLYQDTPTTQFLSLLRLFRLVRLRRVIQLFDILKFSTKVGLMSLTLTRNAVAALLWTHFAACAFYFIAKLHGFETSDTWIGPHEGDLSSFEIYTTSLYWSVVTFTTVGYGDFSPMNASEQIFGMIFMLLNITLMSYIIGSITLLVVKNDEATSEYRTNINTLKVYASANNLLEDDLYHRLKLQLKVEFNHRDIGDEQVLQKFPKTMRQKVMMRLFFPKLQATNLMKGIRQQFINEFLGNCKIVLFSSGEELLTAGNLSSDLFLLVEGTVELSSDGDEKQSQRQNGLYHRISSFETMSSEAPVETRKMPTPDFINEIAFFTESPQIDTVKTVTICKTLIISKSQYKAMAEDHPGSVGRLLHNLLRKVQQVQFEQEESQALLESSKPNTLESPTTQEDGIHMQCLTTVQTGKAISQLKDLVETHIQKLRDDHTIRFLYAASRGDTETIKLMCDQGFNPDTCDYDKRTALMVSAMKGNMATVVKLLEYGANPLVHDCHGSCALLEAVMNDQNAIIDLFLQVCDIDSEWIQNSKACLLMNEAVSTGDIMLLERLIRAGIDVNTYDYDKRRPVHIAAAEGNLAALKRLVEAGADLTVLDRWNNSVLEESRRSKSGALVAYLENELSNPITHSVSVPNLVGLS